MLVTQSFTATYNLVNSDKEIVKQLPSCDFVAIYDNQKIPDSDLQALLNKGIDDDSLSQNKNIVIMKENDWQRLHHMITDNFNLTQKNTTTNAQKGSPNEN